MPDGGVDRLLVERVKQGDRDAYDLLVRKYQHRIAKLISRFISNHAEAEDVLQESFLKAWRAIGNFRGDSAFYTWLYRIAVNTAKNHLSAGGRRFISLDQVNEDGEEETMDIPDIHGPENDLLADEIATTVQRAIAALPPDLRTAILLREIEGLSYEEIAEIMNCPIGTVRSRIFRAREAIDVYLKPLIDGT